MFVRRGRYETRFNEILQTDKMDSAYHTDYHNRSIFYSTLFYHIQPPKSIFAPQKPLSLFVYFYIDFITYMRYNYYVYEILPLTKENICLNPSF